MPSQTETFRSGNADLNQAASRERTAWKDRVSFDFLKRELLKTTYGSESSLLAKLDPRTLFGWYLFFALAPWFTYDPVILIGFVAAAAVVAALSRVSGLIIFFLAFGVITQLVGLGITALLFGGSMSVFAGLSTLLLKLVAVSLASIAAFTALDPERLGDGLSACGLPNQIVFGISYAYRIVPVLIDEYHSIFNAYRMRSRPPRQGFFALPRKGLHFLTLMMRSFYPMMLNTAKRTRSTVESLELRGFGYAQEHPEAKKIRLAHLRFTTRDALFFAANAAFLSVLLYIARLFSQEIL